MSEEHRLGLHRVELSMPGPARAHAAGSLAVRLRKLDGVSQVIVSSLSQRAVVLFDPAVIGLDGILRTLERERFDMDRTLVRWHLPVAGLGCARCARRVEETVGRLPGVGGAIVNRATETLTVEFVPGRADAEAVRGTLQAQGFDPGPDPHPASAALVEASVPGS